MMHQYANYKTAHVYEDNDGNNQDFESAHPESFETSQNPWNSGNVPREDYQDNQDELDQTVPSYHDMAKIQRRPYGQEEEEEYSNQNRVEHTGEEHDSVCDIGIHLDSDRP
ncbi:hypothetical protein BGZ79_009521 [Entomortierella chlamydospora]|nr:hypothetical protein BGZ79_009521 [Entomortierella chlamydospora]